MALAENITVE